MIALSDHLIHRKAVIPLVTNRFDQFGADAMIAGADDLIDCEVPIACGLNSVYEQRCDSVTGYSRELIGGKILVSKLAEFLDKLGAYSMRLQTDERVNRQLLKPRVLEFLDELR